MKKCGIYALKNIVNNKMYIGQSTDIDSRKYHHYYDLRHHKHHSCKLQQDYDLYGKDNFEFLIKVTVNSKNHYCKHIFMFDLNNNFIKEFASIKEASVETGILDSSLIRCCQNKQKTAGGYIWRYKINN